MFTQSSFPFHYVRSPITAEFFTKGKIYEVVRFDNGPSRTYGWGFYLIADSGETTYCLEKQCSMIEEQSWIIADFEENLKKILE